MLQSFHVLGPAKIKALGLWLIFAEWMSGLQEQGLLSWYDVIWRVYLFIFSSFLQSVLINLQTVLPYTKAKLCLFCRLWGLHQHWKKMSIGITYWKVRRSEIVFWRCTLFYLLIWEFHSLHCTNKFSQSFKWLVLVFLVIFSTYILIYYLFWPQILKLFWNSL